MADRSQVAKSDLETNSQWGRYNLNYRETESDEGDHQCDAFQAAAARSEDVGRQQRVHRHTSDVSSMRRTPQKIRRHESDRRAVTCARKKCINSSNDCQNCLNSVVRTQCSTVSLEPCLRTAIARHESDLRKKRVAFADSPSVIWSNRSSDRLAITHNQRPLDPSSAAVDKLANAKQSKSPVSEVGGSLGVAFGDYCTDVKAIRLEMDDLNDRDLLFMGRFSGRRDHRSSHSTAEGEEQVLTSKERRRRKVVMAVVCTTFILLTASALFVLITLFNASAIDEAGNCYISLKMKYGLVSFNFLFLF